MKFLKPYANIKDFLHRFTIVKIGKLHIRLHKILDKDKSTLFHNHPFHYISIILSGGYNETYIHPKTNELIDKSYKFGNIIIRRHSIYHRITELRNNKRVITLFIAYGNFGWKAFNTNQDNSTDGLFLRTINGREVWSKRKNGIWHIGNESKDIAKNETRHSIHQIL